MKHGIEKCRVCENYLRGLDTCKYCSFEWASEYPPTDDDKWDILDLNDDLEWSHYQIMDRLHYYVIDCLFADIFPNNMVILIGCNAYAETIARALGVHKRCIYCDYDHSLIIINLVEEMALRMNMDIDELYEKEIKDNGN